MPKSLTLEPDATGDEWFGKANPTFVFRPIHYLGSKLRVLEAIESAIDRADPTGGPVCDLFSGSATVSRYLSRSRRVAAVDIQEYARVIADAVLNGDETRSLAFIEDALDRSSLSDAVRQAVEPLTTLENAAAMNAVGGDIEPLCELLDVGSLVGTNGGELLSASPLGNAMRETQARLDALALPDADTVCVRHFGGQYFSFAQAAELDAIATFARNSGSSVPLAATLSTASQLVNSIGKQFAQPIRPRDKSGAPKRHVVRKIVAERSVAAQSVFASYLQQYRGLDITRRDHIAVRENFEDALANPAFKPSVVYADPPYTRDHYSRFYHSLETIALGDDPIITSSNLGGGAVQSRGGYRAGRHQSPFCIKSKAPAAFTALFSGVAALRVPLVLSYSGYDPNMEARPRVMALEAVTQLAREHFAEVRVDVIDNFDHMKLNTVALNKVAKGTNEVLITCS